MAKKVNHLIWNRTYDLSEINRSNAHKIRKQYFEITTKRIALLAALLAINIICEVISQYALAIGKINGFLSFSITFWTVLTVYLAINGLYAVIFLEVTEFFRMAFGQDIVSTISLNISDLTYLLIFMVLVFLMNYIRVHCKQPKSKKWSYFIVLCIAMVIAMLATSGLDVVYNKYFLINWYYKTSGSSIDIDSALLIVIFWFNVVEYAINCVIFGAVYNALFVLINHYNQ